MPESDVPREGGAILNERASARVNEEPSSSAGGLVFGGGSLSIYGVNSRGWSSTVDQRLRLPQRPRLSATRSRM